MVKKFSIPCQFDSGNVAPFDFFVGNPTDGKHPIEFQSKWLNDIKGGHVPKDIMDSIKKIKDLADRNNVFTFDTPLARLDKENRALFVEKVLCTISDQVLILSTDEEIVGDLYKIVKKHLSKTYTLINDEKEGKTEIKEAYF